MIDRRLTLVLFGITGDLSQKKLLPAIFSLYKKNKLPKDFNLVGFSRRNFERFEFEDFILKNIKQNVGDKKTKDFLKKVTYLKGDFFDVNSYEKLSLYLNSLDENFGKCFNKMFYLAVPPEIYKTIFKNIVKSGLSVICTDVKGESFSRLLVEKPFGSNFKSSKELNDLSLKLFNEKDIFRVDHYNAKDFVDKISKTEFDYKNITKIEIFLLEKNNVENRANFYDSIGAISDVVQNHILQILSFIALPKNMQSDEHKSVFFDSLKPVSESLLGGQYVGYSEHAGVKKDSKTETYFKGRFKSDQFLPNIDIIISTGKAVAENRTEVVIHFKNKKNKIFSSLKENMNPYEKVLMQALQGNKDIFVGKEEILSSWKLIDKVKKEILKKDRFYYKQGENI